MKHCDLHYIHPSSAPIKLEFALWLISCVSFSLLSHINTFLFSSAVHSFCAFTTFSFTLFWWWWHLLWTQAVRTHSPPYSPYSVTTPRPTYYSHTKPTPVSLLTKAVYCVVAPPEQNLYIKNKMFHAFEMGTRNEIHYSCFRYLPLTEKFVPTQRWFFKLQRPS